MERRAWLSLVSAAVVASACSSGALAAPVVQLTNATDLRADGGAARHAPRLVIVLFSLPDCPYCDAIRREQLVPLSRDPHWMDRVVVREVSIVGSRPMVAFDGREVVESDFAKASAARFSPTVAFFGPDGAQVVPPIVGARIPDFYGAYLDQAVATSLTKMGVMP